MPFEPKPSKPAAERETPGLELTPEQRARFATMAALLDEHSRANPDIGDTDYEGRLDRLARNDRQWPLTKWQQALRGLEQQLISGLLDIRLNTLFRRSPIIVLPFDDLLIDGAQGRQGDNTAGSRGGLRDLRALGEEALAGGVDGLLAFPRILKDDDLEWLYSPSQELTPLLTNVSVSTSHGKYHLDKVTLGDLEEAVHESVDAGATCVTVHFNLGSETESSQLQAVAQACRIARRHGMPVAVHAYWRTKNIDGSDNKHFELIGPHATEAQRDEFQNKQLALVGIMKSIGVDVLKVNWPGDRHRFRSVVEAAGSIPILVAGGEIEAPARTIAKYFEAVLEGAAGAAIGRNTVNHPLPRNMLRAVRETMELAVEIREGLYLGPKPTTDEVVAAIVDKYGLDAGVASARFRNSSSIRVRARHATRTPHQTDRSASEHGAGELRLEGTDDEANVAGVQMVSDAVRHGNSRLESLA